MSPPNNPNNNCPWLLEFKQYTPSNLPSTPPQKPQKPVEQTIIKYAYEIFLQSKL